MIYDEFLSIFGKSMSAKDVDGRAKELVKHETAEAERDNSEP